MNRKQHWNKYRIEKVTGIWLTSDKMTKHNIYEDEGIMIKKKQQQIILLV